MTQVTAVKLTQLFAIQRHELIEVVEGVGELEAEILLRALAAEQKTVVDALKFGRETSRKGEPGGSRRESKRFDDEDEGGEVEEGQKASRLLRRRSKADAAVGNLLTAGSIHGKTQSVGAAGGEAVTATLHLWDDAVDAVKSSTSALEETSKNYRKEVRALSYAPTASPPNSPITSQTTSLTTSPPSCRPSRHTSPPIRSSASARACRRPRSSSPLCNSSPKQSVPRCFHRLALSPRPFHPRPLFTPPPFTLVCWP